MQHRSEEKLSTVKTRRVSRSGSLTGFCLVAAFVGVGFGQVDRSALNGTVTDPSGGLLPGVEVVAVQDSTGLRRTTVSSASGAYSVPELPVGLYAVTFSRDGFQPITFAKVVQELAKTRTLNVSLKVGGAKEHVEVPWDQPLLDQTTNSLGAVIERVQAQQLPLNGRNWANLTTLVPGAIDTGGSNQRSVRFAGRGRDDNNFTYDGVDATTSSTRHSSLTSASQFHWAQSKKSAWIQCSPLLRKGRQSADSWR